MTQQRQGVERPDPVAEAVRLRLAVAEDGLEVHREEADGDVVDDQEDADRERRQDDVGLEHLPERVAQRGLDVDARGARLDQRAVARADHDLVAQLGRELAQEQHRQRPR